VNQLDKLLEIDRLEKQRRKLPQRKGINLMLNIIDRHARHHDDRHGPAMLLEILQHIEAGDARHMEIEQYHRKFGSFNQFECFLATGGFANVETMLTKKRGNGCSLGRRIITNENLLTFCHGSN
jgi:hypothetical protein